MRDRSRWQPSAESRVLLSEQGLGILSEVEVQAALRDEPDEDIGHYTILRRLRPAVGIPGHRHRRRHRGAVALQRCVRARSDGGTDVLVADPGSLLELSGRSDQLHDITGDAKQRLEHPLGTLS